MRVRVFSGGHQEFLGEGEYKEDVTVYFGRTSDGGPDGQNIELVSFENAESKPEPGELGDGVELMTINNCPKIVLDGGKVVYGCQVWWEDASTPLSRDIKKPMECTEGNGIKAIIYLQGLGGIVETEEKARADWNSMSDHDKEFTMEFYSQMNGEKNNVQVPAAV